MLAYKHQSNLDTPATNDKSMSYIFLFCAVRIEKAINYFRLTQETIAASTAECIQGFWEINNVTLFLKPQIPENYIYNTVGGKTWKCIFTGPVDHLTLRQKHEHVLFSTTDNLRLWTKQQAIITEYSGYFLSPKSTPLSEHTKSQFNLWSQGRETILPTGKACVSCTQNYSQKKLFPAGDNFPSVKLKPVKGTAIKWNSNRSIRL